MTSSSCMRHHGARPLPSGDRMASVTLIRALRILLPGIIQWFHKQATPGIDRPHHPEAKMKR